MFGDAEEEAHHIFEKLSKIFIYNRDGQFFDFKVGIGISKLNVKEFTISVGKAIIRAEENKIDKIII